ncbi:MAG: adenine phosphoribosyltransferase [Flavobacteriales bacterium]|nr:adenine phosphoribosyltransferase [Flavobacteriales bacterium]
MSITVLEEKIREVKDFPKEGISFKDITPILADPVLSSFVIKSFNDKLKVKKIDAIVGVESRGFLFGMMLANELNIPFIPVRKAGKLPSDVISEEYDLEYGKAVVEIHTDSIQEGWNIAIHDDLLATGGTANAAANLVKRLGGNISAFLFVVELSFLNGRKNIKSESNEIISLIKY